MRAAEIAGTRAMVEERSSVAGKWLQAGVGVRGPASSPNSRANLPCVAEKSSPLFQPSPSCAMGKVG